MKQLLTLFLFVSLGAGAQVTPMYAKVSFNTSIANNDYVGTISISQSAHANGATAKNSLLPGLLINDTGSRSGQTFNSIGLTDYTTLHRPVIGSAKASRDVIVDSMNFSIGIHLIRIHNGEALFFNYKAGSQLYMGYCPDTSDVGRVFYTFINFRPDTLIAAIGSGDGTGFTHSAVGFTHTLKYNGTVIYSYYEIHCLLPGTTALIGSGGGYGTAGYRVRHLSRINLISNTDLGQVALADLGVKKIKTTGTISMSTPNRIAVADGSQINVGDWVLLPTGHEQDEINAGYTAGNRGTFGIDGEFPSYGFRDSVALRANTTLSSGTWAFDSITRLVWMKLDSGWTRLIDYNMPQVMLNEINRVNADTYENKTVPRALLTQVLSKPDVNTLIVSRPAKHTVNNCPVWVDQTNLISSVLSFLNPLSNYTAYGVVDNTVRTVIYPGDTTIQTRAILLFSRPHWTILGANDMSSVIYAPKGVTAVHLSTGVYSPGVRIAKLTIQSSQFFSSFSYDWWNDDNSYKLDGNASHYQFSIARGFQLISDSCILEDFAIKNTITAAVDVGHPDCIVRRGTVIVDTLLKYSAWIVASANSGNNALFSDIDYYSPVRSTGFESFGTMNNRFHHIRSHGGTLSCNSCINITIDSSTVWVGRTCSYMPTGTGAPMFTWNSNAYKNGIRYGGLADSIEMYITDYADDAKNQYVGINVNEDIGGATIKHFVFEGLPWDDSHGATVAGQAFTGEGPNNILDDITAITNSTPICNCVFSSNIGLRNGSILKNSRVRSLTVYNGDAFLPVYSENNTITYLNGVIQ